MLPFILFGGGSLFIAFILSSSRENFIHSQCKTRIEAVLVKIVTSVPIIRGTIVTGCHEMYNMALGL